MIYTYLHKNVFPIYNKRLQKYILIKGGKNKENDKEETKELL